MAAHRIYKQNADGSQSLVSTAPDLATATTQANTTFNATGLFVVVEAQIPGGTTRVLALGVDNTIPVKPAV